MAVADPERSTILPGQTVAWPCTSAEEHGMVRLLIAASRDYVIYISSRTRFEFDPEKDDANRGKHGVSLSFDARVFEDADYLLIPTFREEDGEDRYKVIGMVDGKFWTAVHVRQGDTVRFISVRRSNDGEEKQYLA
jgi:uncharacterized DUF497 family protein